MADITTIASSDTLSASRAVINANFAALQDNFSSAPAAPITGQLVRDTSGTDLLKIRNAANSAYVTLFPDIETAGGGLLPTAGGTMTGAIAMGTNKITGMGDATAAQDAVTKAGADARVIAVPVLIGTLSATDNKYLFIAGTGTMTIVDVVLVTEASIASDATNHWTFQVQNLTAAVALRSAAKDTNGAAITANTAYALGLDQNLTPASAAVLQLQCTKFSAAGDLTELMAVVRYKVAT